MNISKLRNITVKFVLDDHPLATPPLPKFVTIRSGRITQETRERATLDAKTTQKIIFIINHHLRLEFLFDFQARIGTDLLPGLNCYI